MSSPQPTGCCPPFDPVPWEDRTFAWNDKRFIRDRVRTLFYIPLNFGQVIRRMMARVDRAGAAVPDWLCLADHISRWSMDLYLAVDREVEGAEPAALSGEYYSRVYEGDYQETANWCADYEKQAAAKGVTVKKLYMWYTTCPKCAKKYGKNYVVILAEVAKAE